MGISITDIYHTVPKLVNSNIEIVISFYMLRLVFLFIFLSFKGGLIDNKNIITQVESIPLQKWNCKNTILRFNSICIIYNYTPKINSKAIRFSRYL